MRTQKPEYMDATSWMKICFWTYARCCKYRHPLKYLRLKFRYRRAAGLACSSLSVFLEEPNEQTILALAKYLAYISAYHYNILVRITALNQLLRMSKEFEVLVISKKNLVTDKEKWLIGELMIYVVKTGR